MQHSFSISVKTPMTRSLSHLCSSLRAKYGTSDLQNAVHGSESFNAAQREIKFIFPNSKTERQKLMQIKCE